MKKHEDMSASKILRFLNLKKKYVRFCPPLPYLLFSKKQNIIIYIKEKMIQPHLYVAIIF